jgi:hypothetical protein
MDGVAIKLLIFSNFIAFWFDQLKQLMSPAFLVNYDTMSKVIVDRWWYLVFFFGKKLILKKQNEHFYVCMYHGSVWIIEITEGSC